MNAGPADTHLDLGDLIAEVTGQAVDDRAREHLARCEHCRAEANRWDLVAGGGREAWQTLGRLWDQIPMLTQELGEVLALWEAGRITPRIDATYPFAEAADAHRRILSRQNTGKIVLTP